ncbi:uncharacterized protein DNG_02678 [Cephalotrichum gorgonifer]|uniref:C3H1-type domain-containing protein n=1 Tax=Cephalotrichum gorgonifer TaxID=2041049 RepID=A0AAE8MV48_9PEZI|nr:uncharacterized protein DNG_02678 [Cephalotrichum gorgonifer]
MSRDPPPNPAPPWHLSTNGSHDRTPSSVPGLNPQHALASQSSFEYNRTAIPGLSFAGAQSWTSDAPGTWLSTYQANINPPNLSADRNTNAPAKHGLANKAVAPANIHAPTMMEDDTVEEGELTESAFEDIYEPSLHPSKRNEATGELAQQLSTDGDDDDEDYDPANPGSPTQPSTFRETWPGQVTSTVSSEEARERSRSYSPYLSPHEVEVENSTTSHANMATSGSASQVHPADTIGGASSIFEGVASESLHDARKRAQAAILRLWPLEVRYQDYIEEGIDGNIIRTLFTSLGLDTKSTKPTHSEQPRIHQARQNGTPERQANDRSASPIQAPGSTATAITEAPKLAPTGPQEERKDKIARLMAAKAAKQQPPAGPTQGPTTVVATQPSAPPTQPSASIDQEKAAAEASRKRADKERLLQEKLEKLQKSRVMRAQKASENPSPAPQSNLQDPSLAQVQSEASATVPPAPTHVAAVVPRSHEMESTETATIPKPSAPPIPGLFLSASGSPLVGSRKRPVASDLNDSSAAPPYKRTFNRHYVEKPLVINVSDESDDEDIEMDMSSPIDGPASEHTPASIPQPKSTSLRGLPPLMDKPGRRSLASPASQASITTGAKDGNPEKLNNLALGINDLKRKIADLERQRLAKASSKASPAQSSTNGTPAAEASRPAVPAPIPSGSHSPSSSAAPQGSPTPAGDDVQRILPRVPRASSARDPARLERMRAASNKLLALDANLVKKSAKQRLLESEFARIRKESEDLRLERDRLAQELEQLQAEEDATAGPEQDPLSNGQQQSVEHIPSPNGGRDDYPTAQNPPADTSRSEDQDASTSAAPESPDAEIGDAALPSEATLPKPDLEPPIRPQVPEVTEEVLQPVVLEETDGHATIETAEDTTIGETPRQAGGDSNTSDTGDAMQIDTALDGEETFSRPESPTGIETVVLEAQPEDFSPDRADDTTTLILANADLQEPGAESTALPEHISSRVPDAADEDLDLPAEAENTPEPTSRTSFVPYESMLKGFRSYRFHPRFHKDVKGGLRSPTYSNNINPKVPFCLGFLLGACAKGASCKYQHVDAVNIPDSQILLQLGNSERLERESHDEFVTGLRSLLSEFKSRQCKDFDAITQAIIEYRAANLDFEARVPVPFSVFPSAYREAETQTQTQTQQATTTTTTTSAVEFAASKPGREDKPSVHATVEYPEEKFHYTREEEYRRPVEKHERHYYAEEYRPSHADFAETRVEVDKHSQHLFASTPVDVAEREYRSRVQPSFYNTTVDGAQYRPVQQTTTTRVEEFAVDASRPSRICSEDRSYVNNTTVEASRVSAPKSKMGYYDDDGHYHSFRQGLHRIADKIVPDSRREHHHHHVHSTTVERAEARESRAPRYESGAPVVPNTVTIPCHHIRIGDFLMLQNRPCQVIRISTSAATGQYRYLGVDLFTKQLHEESSFIAHPAPSVVVQTMLGPIFKQYRVLDLQQGNIVAMTETGDVKQDLPIIDQSNLWERLQSAFDSGRGSVRVLVLNDGGRELGVDMKVVHGSRL